MFTKIKSALEFIGVAMVLMSIVDPIKDLVAMVEDIYRGRKEAGPEKKAFVLEVLEQVLDAAERGLKLELPRDTILSFADAIIDILVRVLHLAGIFKHADEEAENPEKKPPLVEPERLEPR